MTQVVGRVDCICSFGFALLHLLHVCFLDDTFASMKRSLIMQRV